MVCVFALADKSDDGDECSDDDGDDSDSNNQEQETWLAELSWRRMHPERLHEELWFNLPHEVCLKDQLVVHSQQFN